MNTNLSFEDTTERLEDFIEYFKKTEVDSPNPCKENHIKPSKTKTEDELYRLFLETHFQSSESANKFNELMNWKKLNNTGDSGIKKVCRDFFNQPKIKIGDHRKHLSCMTPDERTAYTVEGLSSYKVVIKEYQSQRNFFEIDGNPKFDDLYDKMRMIRHFNRRLPRFDHLEKVSRTFNFYCTPNRFYVEDATGPLDGLTYLILGQKFRNSKTRLNEIILKSDFINNWNSNVKSNYQLTDRESRDSTLQKMEQWTIDRVRHKLPKSQQSNPGFIFDLETNICNWQKRK
jgi:hypothetical protein